MVTHNRRKAGTISVPQCEKLGKGLSLPCLFLAIILSSCSTPQKYIARGNRLYNAGKYEEANIAYRNAALKDARSGEAYYRLGLSELKLNHLYAAYEALSRAVVFNPQNLDAKQRLTEVCLTTYNQRSPRPTTLYTQARALNDELLAKKPNSAPALRVKAALALIDKKPNDAVGLMRHAVQASPDSADLKVDLALALFEDSRPEEAERVARETIARHPGYTPVYQLLFAQFASQQRESDVVSILNLWKSNMPDDPTPALRLAAGYYRQHKPDYSETLLDSLLQRRPTISQVDLLVGDFHKNMGEREKALADYERGRSLDRAHVQTYLARRAELLAEMNQRDEALKALDSILSNDPKNLDARTLKLELLTRIGGEQNLKSAAAMATSLSREVPANARIQMASGSAFASTGDFVAASACFHQALKEDPQLIGAYFALAQIALTRKNYPAVLENADAALAIDRADPKAKLLRVIGLARSGSYTQAKAEAEQLARETKGAKPVELQLGIIALHQNNYQEAELHFGKAYQEGDSNSEALAGLMNAYMGEHQPDRALQLAQKEIRRSPQTRDAATLLVASAEAAGKPDVALAELQNLAAKNPKSVDVLTQLGLLQQTQGNFNAALQAFERAHQLRPDRADLTAAVGNVQVALGQKREAIANFRKALSQNPDDPRLLNNLAFVLSESRNNLDEALTLATTASRKSPDNPDIEDTLAWIHIQRGEAVAMIPVLARLTRNNPGNASYRYHYAVALFQKGDRLSAKKELQAALSGRPERQTESEIRTLLEQLR